MAVPLHIESFSTLAQLESVQKSGKLICLLIGFIPPREEEGNPILKKSHTEQWSQHL